MISPKRHQMTLEIFWDFHFNSDSLSHGVWKFRNGIKFRLFKCSQRMSTEFNHYTCPKSKHPLRFVRFTLNFATKNLCNWKVRNIKLDTRTSVVYRLSLAKIELLAEFKFPLKRGMNASHNCSVQGSIPVQVFHNTTSGIYLQLRR